MHLRIAESHHKLNRKRFIVNVTQAARAAGAEVELIEDGWLIRLHKHGITRYIYGDKFDLNSSASAHIAHDKVAASSVLQAAGIPAVPHQLLTIISEPRDNTYNASVVGPFWRTATKPVVCKPLEGSCGNDIHLLYTAEDLHDFIALASCSQVWALAPFFGIAAEYRTVVLDGAVKLQYAKVPAWHTVHDGVVGEAAAEGENVGKETHFALHGLSKGGQAVQIDDSDLADTLAEQALKVAKTCNLRCASVDIIAVGDELLVLEVNDGIALDAFGAQNGEHHQKAIAIYKEIVERMFAGS